MASREKKSNHGIKKPTSKPYFLDFYGLNIKNKNIFA